MLLTRNIINYDENTDIRRTTDKFGVEIIRCKCKCINIKIINSAVKKMNN